MKRHSKGMQDKWKEKKLELLGINKVNKTCRFRPPNHKFSSKKAAVPYNSDIKLLFTAMVVPDVG